MGQEVFASDNSGNRVVFDVNTTDPVSASGLTVATGTAGDDVTLTVVAGATYALTCIGASVLASTTGVTSTAANVEWIAPAGVTIVIKIPVGKTTLYLEGDTGTKNIRIRKLA